MLKTLLIGASALALTAGAASAQTFGTPPGGDVNTAVAGQSTGNNNSIVNQQASNHRADVDQTGGSRNSSRVNQGEAGEANSGRNDAEVDQRGSGANIARIDQIGTSSDNTSSLLGLPGASGRITSPNTGAFDQRAVINQTNNTTAGANAAVIRQGSTLSGQADQGGLRNLATITQNGGANQAGIEQGGGTDREDGNMSSTISQTGNRHIAENIQGEGDSSTINQSSGNDNQAYANQTPMLDSAGFDMYGRISTIDQAGSRNFASVRQNDSLTTSDVDQIGDDNNAAVRQENGSIRSFSQVNQQFGNDRADITQRGADDDSFVRQNNGGGNSATHNQAGPRNVARTIQARFDNYNTATNNVSSITQTASSRNVFGSVGQSGDGNNASITQSQAGRVPAGVRFTGNNGNDYRDNVTPDATVIQSSIRSKATVIQRADGARMDSYQGYDDTVSTDEQLLASNGLTPVPGFEVGSEDNELTVLQEVGATNAFSGNIQGGDQNIIRVNQNAADVVSRIRQLGNVNIAEVNQTFNAQSRSVVSQFGNNNNALVNQ